MSSCCQSVDADGPRPVSTNVAAPIAVPPKALRLAVVRSEVDELPKPPPRNNSKDLAIVEQIVAGNPEAISELYDRHASMLLAMARRILHDQSEAEEVLQDTFVQVWKQAARYRSSRASVSTWLVLLTRSRAVDRLRSRAARQRAISAARGEGPQLSAAPKGPDDVLQHQRRQRLNDKLDQLPRDQRRVLELAFYGGMTQLEISVREEIPLGTVKSRSRLAMRTLRQLLHDDLQELL